MLSYYLVKWIINIYWHLIFIMQLLFNLILHFLWNVLEKIWIYKIQKLILNQFVENSFFFYFFKISDIVPTKHLVGKVLTQDTRRPFPTNLVGNVVGISSFIPTNLFVGNVVGNATSPTKICPIPTKYFVGNN
jgi:hypothetical protein